MQLAELSSKGLQLFAPTGKDYFTAEGENDAERVVVTNAATSKVTYNQKVVMLVLDPGIRWFGFPGQAYGRPDGAAGISGRHKCHEDSGEDVPCSPLRLCQEENSLVHRRKKTCLFRPSTLSN